MDVVFKGLKEKGYWPISPYLAKVALAIGGMKLFPEKQRWREFVASRSDLQEELKGVLQTDANSDRHKEMKSTAEKNCIGK